MYWAGHIVSEVRTCSVLVSVVLQVRCCWRTCWSRWWSTRHCQWGWQSSRTREPSWPYSVWRRARTRGPLLHRSTANCSWCWRRCTHTCWVRTSCFRLLRLSVIYKLITKSRLGFSYSNQSDQQNHVFYLFSPQIFLKDDTVSYRTVNPMFVVFQTYPLVIKSSRPSWVKWFGRRFPSASSMTVCCTPFPPTAASWRNTTQYGTDVASLIDEDCFVFLLLEFVLVCMTLVSAGENNIIYECIICRACSRWSRKPRSLRSLWKRWSFCRVIPQTCSNMPEMSTVTLPARSAKMSSWQPANWWPPRCTTLSRYMWAAAGCLQVLSLETCSLLKVNHESIIKSYCEITSLWFSSLTQPSLFQNNVFSYLCTSGV